MYVHPVLIKVLIPLDQDITKIWSDLKHYGDSSINYGASSVTSIHLLGSNRQYMIVYTGFWDDALDIDSYFHNIKGAVTVALTMDYSVALDPVTLLSL